ncbi:hypothetical protein TrVE_jg583 [Triparma verrucosa]|uniref:Uncharacterized protein n=1 Tax=Triparma verrucosa TaxID=1606542 RepID=A0A9W7B6M1_9STRA|nr:hypothetical protein TrVE_jg583 [Triparma verrucosa]
MSPTKPTNAQSTTTPNHNANATTTTDSLTGPKSGGRFSSRKRPFRRTSLLTSSPSKIVPVKPVTTVRPFKLKTVLKPPPSIKSPASPPNFDFTSPPSPKPDNTQTTPKPPTPASLLSSGEEQYRFRLSMLNRPSPRQSLLSSPSVRMSMLSEVTELPVDDDDDDDDGEIFNENQYERDFSVSPSGGKIPERKNSDAPKTDGKKSKTGVGILGSIPTAVQPEKGDDAREEEKEEREGDGEESTDDSEVTFGAGLSVRSSISKKKPTSKKLKPAVEVKLKLDESFDVVDDEDYLNEPDDVSHGVSNATPMQNTMKRQQQQQQQGAPSPQEYSSECPILPSILLPLLTNVIIKAGGTSKRELNLQLWKTILSASSHFAGAWKSGIKKDGKVGGGRTSKENKWGIQKKSVEEILNDLAEKKEGRWTVKEGLERLEVGNEEFVEGRGEGCLGVKGVIMGDGYGGRLRNLRGWNGFQPNLPFDTEVDVVTRIGEEEVEDLDMEGLGETKEDGVRMCKFMIRELRKKTKEMRELTVENLLRHTAVWERNREIAEHRDGMIFQQEGDNKVVQDVKRARESVEVLEKKKREIFVLERLAERAKRLKEDRGRENNDSNNEMDMDVPA